MAKSEWKKLLRSAAGSPTLGPALPTNRYLHERRRAPPVRGGGGGGGGVLGRGGGIDAVTLAPGGTPADKAMRCTHGGVGRWRVHAHVSEQGWCLAGHDAGRQAGPRMHPPMPCHACSPAVPL